MIKIGILGAAKIAPKAIVLPASLRDDCEISCVASRDEDKAKGFARDNGIANFETSYESLVQRDDVDLVYNALPPSRHCDLSIAALQAGKAVLCEKPFAMNAHEARLMVDTAKKHDRPLIEAFHYRYHPAFLRFLEIVQSETIGNIKSVDACFNVAIPYSEGELRHIPELGGGALMDLGCYPVHSVRTIIGGEPVSVSASCYSERPDIDISTSADLVFADGVIAKIETSMAVGEAFHAEITVVGDHGSAHMNNPIHPYLDHLITVTKDGKSETETANGKTTFDYQLAHVMSVMSGETQPLTAGEDAVANMKLIDAIYQSAGLR